MYMKKFAALALSAFALALVAPSAPAAYAQSNSAAYTSVLARMGELDNDELKRLLGLLTDKVAVMKDGADAQKRVQVEVQHPVVAVATTKGADESPEDSARVSSAPVSSASGCSALDGLSLGELVKIQLANPLLGTNFGGSATKADIDRIKRETGIDLSGGLSSGNPCITSSTFLDAIATAAAEVAATATGGSGSSASGGQGSSGSGGGSSGSGSSDWEVCDGCTKGDLYLSYYDKDGYYHAGVAYEKSRDDNNSEHKIPGTQFAWRQCSGNSQLYYDFCGLSVFDPDGIKLTTVAFDPPVILGILDRFGIPVDQLKTIADYFDSAGMHYQPYELIGDGSTGGGGGTAMGGYASDHGIDLRDLADGGLGTAYDWRLDNCDRAAAVPGFAWTKESCERAAAEDVAIAEKWGLKASEEVTTGPTVESIKKNSGAWCVKPDDQLTADIYRESYGIGGWQH
ncbi:MAG TPA: hypothetical protein VHO23_02385, partial [Candidatus Paceibacterota bacterium]|nr:hypothetical protein [Candidatus Paceibacterota bacterium]